MAETMLRGSKVRIYPNKRQAQILDLWRRRTISLWNLLLELEQAAYSGQKSQAHLHWREKLVEIARENYERDLHVWNHGRSGKRAKKPGHELLDDYEREKAAYEEKLKRWEESGKKAFKPKEPVKPKPPDPPSQDWIAKILNGRDGTLYFPDDLDEDGDLQDKAYQPRLFIWARELMALMARLKKEGHTHWIGDLPSHAAQVVAKDLVKALEAMLRERRKRATGNKGRDTGFPKFKASRYASGSVYLANTQFSIEIDAKSIRDTVRLPNGIGQCRCIWLKWPEKRDDLTALEQAEFEKLQEKKTIKKKDINPADVERLKRNKTLKKAKLMGGRLWREGEKWFMSCQWEMDKPEPLPETRREAGVKIGAKILLTTFDECGHTQEFDPPPIDKRAQRRHKLEGRRLARCLIGQKKKKSKLAARKKNVHGGQVRLRRSAGFFEASARLAKLEARERNGRDDYLHKLTSGVVREFGAIAVQKMDVAPLMEKESTKRKRRLARINNAVERNAASDDQKRRRPMKPVRKMMRHAAMSRTYQLLEYKQKDLRGLDAHQKIDPYDVNVTACSGCGTIHPEWREVRGIVRCHEVLASGKVCGTALPRNRNAARLTKSELDARKNRTRKRV